MKKILCLLMAAVLAVVMMAPMEARAQVIESTVPAYISSPVAQVSGVQSLDDSKSQYYVDYTLIYEAKWASGTGGYIDGYTVFTMPFVVNTGSHLDVSWQIIDFGTNIPTGYVAVASPLSGNITTSSTYSRNMEVTYRSIDSPLAHGNANFYANIFVTVRITWTVYGDYVTFPKLTASAPNVKSNLMIKKTETRLFSKLDLLIDSVVDKIDGLGSQIADNFNNLWANMQMSFDKVVSGIGNFKSQVGNWFQTQWTFGRQWTDDIIDAIVGQSGGQSIGTAQDELDNQLNSIENVEQQLSDQVLDKVDVPSISLSSDETGGLNWVVSTINSIYVAFDELHVMFACVVFFSICAVLLFGRRNL